MVTWYGKEKILEFFEKFWGFYHNKWSRSRGVFYVLVGNKTNCQLTGSLNVNTDLFEEISVALLWNIKEITNSSIYRPSDAKFEEKNFINLIETALQPMTSCGSEIFVCGELNLDMFKINGLYSCSSIFYNTMSSLSLLPVISKHTRITADRCTLINNIFSINFQNFTSGIMTSDIKYRLPIFVINCDY